MADDLKNQALDAVDTVAEKVSNAKEDVVAGVKRGAASAKAKARKVANAANKRAASTKRDIQEAAEDGYEDARDALDETSRRLGRRLRNAAGDMQEEVAELPARIRSGAHNAIDTLRSTSAAEIAQDVRGLARRNPGWFMAGAALAGFALAQVLRGGRDDDRNYR